MKRARERESGATAVEFVVLTPLLFLLMFGSVQVGLALFARHVAISAAQQGARTAREQADSPGLDWRGHSTTAAKSWVTDLLGDLVDDGPTAQPLAPVPVGDQNPQVGVSVQFGIATVVPGWTFAFTAQSVGPVECFYTPAGFCNGP
ncbi:MAG TPA: TadE/TadG family type IV pilus assembly protein [Actinospica sp.]|nr:TadE/TadG family type IV pilus assembly protein [Actinospica sp.]